MVEALPDWWGAEQETELRVVARKFVSSKRHERYSTKIKTVYRAGQSFKVSVRWENVTYQDERGREDSTIKFKFLVRGQGEYVDEIVFIFEIPARDFRRPEPLRLL